MKEVNIQYNGAPFTFGDPDEYPMVSKILEKYKECNTFQRSRIHRIINKFNADCKKLTQSECSNVNYDIILFYINGIKNIYYNRIYSMVDTPRDIQNLLNNYVVAKIRKLKKQYGLNS